MRLWMSKMMGTQQCTFWFVQPEVTWDRDKPRIGYELRNTEKMLCNMHIDELFPRLSIPPGEMTQVDIIPLENGYYIGLVDE